MGQRGASSKSHLVHEWAVLALCLGVGGHIALAVVLHAPERWPWSHAGLYGLVLGVGVYVSVQLIRTLWWVVRGRSKAESLSGQGQG
jgi:hypothetical protein